MAGILFIVVALSSAAIQGRMPTYAESGEVITAWFNGNASRYLAGQFVSGLGFLLFYIPFVAGLCERLWTVEESPKIWSRTAFGGGILFPAAGIAGGVFLTGLALMAGDISPAIARVMAASGSYGVSVSGALSAILMGATAIVIFKTRVFSIWLGWLGGLAAVASIIGSAAILEANPNGLFSAIGSMAWLIFFVWAFGIAIAMMNARELYVNNINQRK